MILTHPSRPCIFWGDWIGANKAVITALIAIRQRNSINPTSHWHLVHARRALYAAIVGDAVAVKLGQDPWDPNQGLASQEWVLSASGDVHDVIPLPPVEPRIVAGHHLLLYDASFDCEGQDGGTIKARITAFCTPPIDPTFHLTIRVVAADERWPWPASNDTNKYRIRDGLIMHWASATSTSAAWERPSDDILPPNSDRVDDAVQTRFGPADSWDTEADGWDDLAPHVLEVRLRVAVEVKALNFVLKHPARAHDGEDRWYKADGDFHRPPSDFHVRMPKKDHGDNFWMVWERIRPDGQDVHV